MPNASFRLAMAATAIATLGFIAATRVAGEVVAELEAAGQTQCASADWPAHQDRAHRDWCALEFPGVSVPR